jgi:hypothetical protein
MPHSYAALCAPSALNHEAFFVLGRARDAHQKALSLVSFADRRSPFPRRGADTSSPVVLHRTAIMPIWNTDMFVWQRRSLRLRRLPWSMWLRKLAAGINQVGRG